MSNQSIQRLATGAAIGAIGILVARGVIYFAVRPLLSASALLTGLVLVALATDIIVNWRRERSLAALFEAAQPDDRARRTSGVWLLDRTGQPHAELPVADVAGVRAITDEGVVVQARELGWGLHRLRQTGLLVDGHPVGVERVGRDSVVVGANADVPTVMLSLASATYGSGERLIATTTDGVRLRDDVIERWRREPFIIDDTSRTMAQVLALAGIDRTLGSVYRRLFGR